MNQAKLESIFNSLQNCYKISVQNDYDLIQEDLLSVIVDLKPFVNIKENKKIKDYTKFNINLKLNSKSLNNLPKARVPEKIFEYLITNKFFDKAHFDFFFKNNFRTDFATKSGDLIYNYEQKTDKVERYTKFIVDEQTYFACNQWTKLDIDKFNDYINKEFAQYIEVVAAK